MVALFVLGVLILTPGISTLIDQRRQIAELRASVEQHTNAVEEADTERDRWKDPAYIRAQARDRLFFVMPGETQLSVIDDVVISEAQQQTASQKISRAERDWLRGLTASFLSAGVTTATPEELQQ